MSADASGGPIWLCAPERPLELATLGARMEIIGADHFKSLGPPFDLQDYWQLLATLRAEVPSN